MQAASVPPDEPARLKAVRRYEKLLRAAQLCGTPISLVTVVGEDTQWFLSAVGLDVEETPRDVSFCAHTILGADLFEVRDTHTDERFHDNPLVTGDPGVRFYAGAPLVTPSGHRLGTVCVIDREPRQLTLEQREALARLATQVGKSGSTSSTRDSRKSSNRARRAWHASRV